MVANRIRTVTESTAHFPSILIHRPRFSTASNDKWLADTGRETIDRQQSRSRAVWSHNWLVTETARWTDGAADHRRRSDWHAIKISRNSLQSDRGGVWWSGKLVKRLLNEDDCLLFLVDYVSQPVRILAANLYWLSCAKCDCDLIDVLHAIWDGISKAKSSLHLSIL